MEFKRARNERWAERGRPEIPDSSKWSSNLRERPDGQGEPDPKYQIPVSGVQTSLLAVSGSVVSIAPKYQIPVSGVQTGISSDLLHTYSPEIPDSSKWSSNDAERHHQSVVYRPEIPDSSKWSSNSFAMESHSFRIWPEIPDSSKWSSNQRQPLS